MMENIAGAEEILSRYKRLAINQNDETLLLRIKLAEFSIFDAKGNKTERAKLEKELLEQAEDITEAFYLIQLYLTIGHSQYINDDLEGALTHFKKAYDISTKIGDESGLGEALNSLANLYIDFNDTETAIQYFDEALALKRKLGDKFSESVLLYNQGKAFIAEQRYNDAKRTLEEALAISETLEDEIGVIWARFTLAEVYLAEGNPELAVAYYHETSVAFEQTADTRMHFQAKMGLAKAFIALNEVDKAMTAIQESRALIEKINNPRSTAYFTQTLALAEAANQNYQAAFNTQKSYSDQQYQIFQDLRKQDTEKLRVKFDMSINENKNKLLKKENELKNLEILRQQQEKSFWIGLITLALIIVIVVFYLLYKQVQHRNRYKEMALKDHLTQAPNRRAIMKYAEERFNEAVHTGMELSIALLDLDHFKKINDRFGHDAGDEVLKRFAQACGETFRQQDRYGRYGGEEWLVVLSDTTKEHIESLFSRLCKNLNSKEITGIPDDSFITFSMGVAQFNKNDTRNLHSLINSADENLYRAKAAGRNQVCI